jgi:hypothetical protein
LRQIWEYKTGLISTEELTNSVNDKSITEIFKQIDVVLNGMGSEGWELVGVTDDPIGLTYFMKRQRYVNT